MKDEGMLDEERNITLLILLAIKTYAEENGEWFSVSTEALNAQILENIDDGTPVPQVAISDENGQMMFQVTMREPSDKEIETYETVYGVKDE